MNAPITQPERDAKKPSDNSPPRVPESAVGDFTREADRIAWVRQLSQEEFEEYRDLSAWYRVHGRPFGSTGARPYGSAAGKRF